MQLGLPEPDVRPRGHSAQDDDPSTDCFPGEHARHASRPDTEYEPAGQSGQASTSPGEEVPGSQGVHAVAPTGASVCIPAPQGKHPPYCGRGAYVPRSHATQLTLWLEYSPGRQDRQ